MKLALVGAGAIADTFYGPALRHLTQAGDCQVTVFDREASRAQGLCQRYGLEDSASEILDAGGFDGAIIATPPAAHLATAAPFLQGGIPTLCEKPLAATSEDCTQLLLLSEQHDAPVWVNLQRRLFPSSQKARLLIEEGHVGEIQAVHVWEGSEFSWPTRTGFYFGSGAKRGVLEDRGSHALDLISWWLGDELTCSLMEHDSRGGTEASCRLRLESTRGVQVQAHFSWLSKLRNVTQIIGTQGTIEIEAFAANDLRVRSRGRERRWQAATPVTFADLGKATLHHFVAGIRDRQANLAPAADAAATVSLIDDCYAKGRFSERLFGGFA